MRSKLKLFFTLTVILALASGAFYYFDVIKIELTDENLTINLPEELYYWDEDPTFYYEGDFSYTYLTRFTNRHITKTITINDIINVNIPNSQVTISVKDYQKDIDVISMESKLSTPRLYYRFDTLHWYKVSDADYYEVIINGETHEYIDNYITFSELDFENNYSYNIKVKGVSNNVLIGDSEYSVEHNIVYLESFNFDYNNDDKKLEWNETSKLKVNLVKVNETTHEVNNGILNDINLEEGINNFSFNIENKNNTYYYLSENINLIINKLPKVINMYYDNNNLYIDSEHTMFSININDTGYIDISNIHEVDFSEHDTQEVKIIAKSTNENEFDSDKKTFTFRKLSAPRITRRFDYITISSDYYTQGLIMTINGIEQVLDNQVYFFTSEDLENETLNIEIYAYNNGRSYYESDITTFNIDVVSYDLNLRKEDGLLKWDDVADYYVIKRGNTYLTTNVNYYTISNFGDPLVEGENTIYVFVKDDDNYIPLNNQVIINRLSPVEGVTLTSEQLIIDYDGPFSYFRINSKRRYDSTTKEISYSDILPSLENGAATITVFHEDYAQSKSYSFEVNLLEELDNLKILNQNITFKKHKDIESYELYINNELAYTGNSTSITYDLSLLKDGTNEFKLYLISNKENLLSTSHYYEVNKLSVPIIDYYRHVIRNANHFLYSQYELTVNGEFATTFTKSYNINDLDLSTESTIKIRSIAKDNFTVNSDYSEPLIVGILSSVENINYDNSTERLYFDEIENASRYIITINEEEYTAYNNYFDTNMSLFDAGEINISIVAVHGLQVYLDSLPSTKTFEKLETPSGAHYNVRTEKLYFNKVSGVNLYSVLYQREETLTSLNQVNIDFNPDINLTIKITATDASNFKIKSTPLVIERKPTKVSFYLLYGSDYEFDYVYNYGEILTYEPRTPDVVTKEFEQWVFDYSYIAPYTFAPYDPSGSKVLLTRLYAKYKSITSYYGVDSSSVKISSKEVNHYLHLPELTDVEFLLDKYKYINLSVSVYIKRTTNILVSGNVTLDMEIKVNGYPQSAIWGVVHTSNSKRDREGYFNINLTYHIERLHFPDIVEFKFNVNSNTLLNKYTMSNFTYDITVTK